MTPELLALLIPIVAILMPVLIFVASKYFKLREREMALEREAYEWAEKQQRALEQRVKRLEDVVLSLDQDVRSRLGLGQGVAPPLSCRELMEGPATPGGERTATQDPLKAR